MTTHAPDWADEEAGRLTKEYWSGTSGDEISVSAADTSAALRAAYERGKAEGERLGRIKGLREAADLSYRSPMYTDLSRDNEGLLMPGSPYDHGRYESRKAIRTRADELEKESANG